MEGTPDHHEAYRSRETPTVDLGATIAFSDPCTEAKSRRHGDDAALAKAREAEEAAERDRGVRGSVAPSPWEQHAHAHDPGREARGMRSRAGGIRRSGRGRRETPRSPEVPYGAQDSVGCPRRESGERKPGTHEVRVHAFVWVAEIGRMHRASFAPGGRKTSW